MEAVLIDTWLRGAEGIEIEDEAAISVAREEVRSVAARLGLSIEDAAAMATVASELAYNQLKHARGGQILIKEIAHDGVAGIEIVAADRGGGIADVTRALRGGASTSGGLGIGLAGVRELADAVDFDVRIGEGTCVWARKFAARVRRRREIGIYGYPHPEEVVSGDHAAFVRSGNSIAVAVADGLGHGPLARNASTVAISRFLDHADRKAPEIFEACHTTMKQTRGAVMAIAHVREPDGAMTTASVGNVTACVCGPDTSKRFGGASFVLGSPGALRTTREDRQTLGTRDAMILFTDGIASRATFERRLDLLREHPIVIAQTAVEEFARKDDDVLVLAIR